MLAVFISGYFAQPEQDSEAEHRLELRYRWTPEGLPVLEDTALQLSCSVAATHVAGTTPSSSGKWRTRKFTAASRCSSFVGNTGTSRASKKVLSFQL
jgi:hypothetical protein